MTTAIVHIGLHKTGTTSFQEWLREHSRLLAAEHGVRAHRGMFMAGHIEVPQLVLRPSLMVPARTIAPDCAIPAVRDATLRHVRATVEASDQTVVFSAEALSWSRTREEVDALVDLLAPRDVHVVAVFREKHSFLQSYRAQFVRMQGEYWTTPLHHESFMNVSPASWIVDYDAICDLWTLHPRIAGFTAIDYEERLKREGSILPALIRATGLDPAQVPSSAGIWSNRTVTDPGDG